MGTNEKNKPERLFDRGCKYAVVVAIIVLQIVVTYKYWGYRDTRHLPEVVESLYEKYIAKD